jgi:hypothetical protein
MTEELDDSGAEDEAEALVAEWPEPTMTDRFEHSPLIPELHRWDFERMLEA